MVDGKCTGRGDSNGDHCCYTPKSSTGVCPFLEFNTVEGRNFVCGLRRKSNSWDDVYLDSRYQAIWGDFKCGDFGPKEKQCCYEERGI